MNGRGSRTTRGAMRAIVMMAVWVSSSGAARASADPLSAGQPVTTGQSAAAFYNAGNAEVRAGHPALAVLDYERARLLDPTDPDIAANLRHVREAAGLPPRTGGWLQAHARLARPDTLYWLGVAGIVCAGISLIMLRARPRDVQLQPLQSPAWCRRPMQIVALAGVLLAVLSLGDAVATNSVMHEYVVLDTAPATGSPVSNGAPLFTLGRADVVEARDAHQGFLLVTDSQARQGWVARTHLAPVVPQTAAT